jgi:hypothetical protein
VRRSCEIVGGNIIIRRDEKVKLNPLVGGHTNVFQDRRWSGVGVKYAAMAVDVWRGITEDARKGVRAGSPLVIYLAPLPM